MDRIGKTTIERYEYTTDAGEVTIEFVDGMFSGCKFPFRGMYSREEWRELGQIADTIVEIEKIKEFEEVE